MTPQQYALTFQTERASVYPTIDAFEDRMGFALDRDRLEAAAARLACPIKVHPPNWQHGRVLYAAVRRYCADRPFSASEPITILDIGTAKGFSALCLKWAALDARVPHRVISVDVIDPAARVQRNSIAETDGSWLTLAEFVQPWPEAREIDWVQGTGRDWLRLHNARVHVAFVDGKHDYPTVKTEAEWLTHSQRTADLTIFDDLQNPGVRAAVEDLRGYAVERIAVLSHREYAVARRVC